MKFKIFPLIALMIAATACDSDDYHAIEDKDGVLDLSNLLVDVQNDPLVIESRAGQETIDPAGYTVTITSAQEDKVVGTWLYKDIPSTLTLPAGGYRVDVKSHIPEPAEWEKPYFAGTRTFEIKDGETTTIDKITCSFSSVKVTVTIAPDLARRLEGEAATKIECGEGTITFSSSEQRAAYFVPAQGVSTLIATFNATIKGQVIEFRKVFGDIAPGQHRKITLYAKNGQDKIPAETGQLNAHVTIDATMGEETINGNLDVEEDVIGPQGSDDSGITFSSSTIDFDKINAVNYPSYIVNIHAQTNFTHLRVKIETDNDNFYMAVTDLLPIEFDLANPNGRDEDFKSLGLPIGTQVTGTNDIDVDISQFVPLLAAYPGIHKFLLSVEDQAGKKANRTLTFESR